MLRPRFKKPLVFRPRPDRKFDPAYQRVLRETIAADDEDRPVRRVRGARLDEELKPHLWLDLLEHKGLIVDRQLFAGIYERTRQQLLAPEVTERMEMLCAAWSQPEGQALWERWSPPVGARNAAAYESAKAVMTVTAGMAETWLKHGRGTLRGSALARETFSELSRRTSRRARLPASGPLPVREYSAVTKVIKGLVDDETALLLQEMCVGVVRELARMFPELPIGHWVSVDAEMVAAWTEQVSGNINGKPDPEREAYLRRRCPDAGYRVYGYDAQGIGDPHDRSTIRDPKKVRGYLQLLATETLTGLPLVGVLVDAATFEQHTLRTLLLRLYGMWPDIPLEGVIGDKHYDTSEACLICELDFGLTPVFIRQPWHAERGGVPFKPDEQERIARFDGWGVAYCRAHNQPMRMERVEMPKRTALAPGETADPRELRYRLRCMAPDSCGRPNYGVTNKRPDGRDTALPSALVGLPHHHLSGRPELFAKRQALQAVRNSASESAFSSLALGFGLGGRDSKRPRVYDREAVDTLHWCAFGTRSLIMLLAHRMHEDEVHAHLQSPFKPSKSGAARSTNGKVRQQ